MNANAHRQQLLVIRDRQADAPDGLDLTAARQRELVDSILRSLVAPLPTPASPPGTTVATAAVQPPRTHSTDSTLTTDATLQPKGGEHVA